MFEDEHERERKHEHENRFSNEPPSPVSGHLDNSVYDLTKSPASAAKGEPSAAIECTSPESNLKSGEFDSSGKCDNDLSHNDIGQGANDHSIIEIESDDSSQDSDCNDEFLFDLPLSQRIQQGRHDADDMSKDSVNLHTNGKIESGVKAKETTQMVEFLQNESVIHNARSSSADSDSRRNNQSNRSNRSDDSIGPDEYNSGVDGPAKNIAEDQIGKCNKKNRKKKKKKKISHEKKNRKKKKEKINHEKQASKKRSRTPSSPSNKKKRKRSDMYLETFMVMEPRLDSNNIGAYFRERITEDGYVVGSPKCTSALPPMNNDFNNIFPVSPINNEDSNKMTSQDLDGLRSKIDVIRWERLIHGVHQTFPWIVLRMSAQALVELYNRKSPSDDHVNRLFFLLTQWASNEVGKNCSGTVFEGNPRVGRECPQVVIVVEGLDNAIGRHSSRHNSRRLPSSSLSSSASSSSSFAPQNTDLRSRISISVEKLYMLSGVHFHFYVDQTETAKYLSGVTRKLAEAPFLQKLTSLSCVTKVKVPSLKDDKSAPLVRSWIGVLAQIPGVSVEKAKVVASHFPTFRSLHSTYTRLCNDVVACEGLLEYKLGSGKREKALSARIWKSLCSNDPEEDVQ